MIEKWLQYTCDGCGETEQSADPNATAKAVRQEIRKFGWKNHGRLDYCKSCVELGLAAERVEGFGS